MKFTTADSEIKLAPDYRVQKISGRETFPFAFCYLTGWYEQGTIFEVNDFCTDRNFYQKVLGLQIPEKVQFTCKPSHLTAWADFADFKAEFHVNTVRFFDVQVEAFFIPRLKKPLYYTKKSTDSIRKVLLENSSICVDTIIVPENKIYVESSTSLTLEALINFWLRCPGFTDGPEIGSSVEKIKDFLIKNNRVKVN